MKRVKLVKHITHRDEGVFETNINQFIADAPSAPHEIQYQQSAAYHNDFALALTEYSALLIWYVK